MLRNPILEAPNCWVRYLGRIESIHTSLGCGSRAYYKIEAAHGQFGIAALAVTIAYGARPEFIAGVEESSTPMDLFNAQDHLGTV